jgi:CRISPR/Cas system-associated exonuclease Cas4 (RecB family)
LVSTTKLGKPVPWSYSSLQSFETCPRRFYLTRITKQVKEPQTDATMHGNEVHKALEEAVSAKRALPPKYLSYQPIVDRLRAVPGKKVLEYRFGLTRDLKECEFFGDNVWVRGVLDVGIVLPESRAIIADYKTGKRKLDGDQMRLFAMAGFALWPWVENISTAYVWLQSNQLDREEFTRPEQSAIHQEFAIRVHRMENASNNNDWPPRPSGLCKAWCPVGKSLCEHCGK